MSQKIEIRCSEIIRLDDFLRKYFESNMQSLLDNAGKNDFELSNGKIRRFIISGSVSVNKKQIRRPAFELRGNSFISFDYDQDKFFYEKQPDDIKFEVSDKDILFEDENLIFVNKPSSFPVEQTITGNRDNLHDSVVKYLWNRNQSLRNPPYVGIVHRLDRETSGVILFTKTRAINKDIHDLFENHSFEKEYYAVVRQNNKIKVGDNFTVENYIGRVSKKTQAGKWGSVSEQSGGEYAKTEFRVLENCKINGANCLVVCCKLFTGRTHQIRVHLSGLGLPIVGDELYGGFKSNRMMLHAYKLSFIHPITKKELVIISKCPFYEKK